MRGCGKTVVITHLEYDSNTDSDISQVQTLHGCSWYSQNKTSVDSTGIHAARVFKCRIPESAAGGMPLKLSAGDLITCDGEKATVLDWHDNRDKAAPHWYVEAG